MEENNYVDLDFSYIDEHMEMIQSKIINYAKVSIYNGLFNKIYLIEKINENEYKYSYNISDDFNMNITYENLIEEIMTFYKSSTGKITIIYRIFTKSINSKTNGEFRELWGDILYINPNTLKLTYENIDANNLSNIVTSLSFTEEEEKVFGKIEEYVFKDNKNNTILGLDLL